MVQARSSTYGQDSGSADNAQSNAANDGLTEDHDFLMSVRRSLSAPERLARYRLPNRSVRRPGPSECVTASHQGVD